MKQGMQILALSRPVTMILVVVLYVIWAEFRIPELAVLTISAAFFLVSNAVLLKRLAVPRAWVRRVWWLELAWITGLTLISHRWVPHGPMQILFYPAMVTLFSALERREWRQGAVIISAAWVAAAVPGWVTWTGGNSLASAALYGTLLLFSGSSGYVIQALTEERERTAALLKQVADSQSALERAHRQLQQSLASQQEMAVLHERQRLAREIHDGVAHALTALVVQVQAGRRLLERSPEESVATLRRCEEMAREALQETRRAVRALHPGGLEQASCLTALERLGRDFGLATGIEVVVTADEAAGALPPDPQRVEQLYRIFQEALTNAHRHGHAHRVRADLRITAGRLTLSISNDGLSPSSLEPGLGLKSMQERMHTLGGDLVVTPGVVGLTVLATVPLEQEANQR